MENQTFTIHTKLVTLNEYINAERSNKYAGAKIKKQQTELCRLSCLTLKPIDYPFKMICEWGIGRHDPDNVAFAKKFILDGMVKSERLPNDNFKFVKGFEDRFIKGETGVTIIIEEV